MPTGDGRVPRAGPATALKVLVVTNDFLPKVGGANYYVTEIVRRFPAGEITVFASAWPGSDAHDAAFPHRVIRWPVRTLLPTPSVIAAVSELVRELRPDLLLFGAAFPLALIGVRVRRRFGVPYASFTHGLELGAAMLPPGRTFLRHVFGPAALVTAVSRFSHRRLAPLIGSGTRLDVLPSGIDRDLFTPGESSNGVRARHRLGEGPVVCCVSRLVARKGQDQLIRTLPRLAAEWPGVRLLIVGGGSDAGRLRRLASRLGVAGRVVMTGEIDYAQLPDYFRAGDVFAMPCRSRFGGLETEALGAVYLQAAAVGRPCVAGCIGGAPEAVRDGDTGLVVDGTNLAAVAAAVGDLLRDPVRASTMGAAAARWVHSELTWDAIAARLRASLLDCLDAPPAR